VINLGIVPMALRHPDVAPMGMGIPPMRGPLGRVRNALLTAVADRIVFAPVQRLAEKVLFEATGLPIDGARPVVHVTQGTVANQDYGQLIRPAIEGLAGADVLVVVSTGGRDMSTLDFPLPANVRVAPYLPYDGARGPRRADRTLPGPGRPREDRVRLSTAPVSVVRVGGGRSGPAPGRAGSGRCAVRVRGRSRPGR
jgi:hypothetical protein